MKYLFIINKGPYGSEEPYNALRLAMTLLKEQDASVSIFLMGDAVVNALSGQQTPDGYYNMERYLKGVLAKKTVVKLCGTCMDARGITDDMIVKRTERSTMSELGELTEQADKVLVF